MKTHAYLIMAHNEPEVLKVLLTLLDDSRNSIYIHIDIRSTSIDKTSLPSCCKKAKVEVIESEKVYWSGYSQVEITLKLLKQALKEKHGYFHLISGVDLPLKTQDELHDFFDQNDGKEFVSHGIVNTWKIASRYKYYHFEKLTIFISRKSYRVLRVVLDTIQQFLLIDRTRGMETEFHFGGQWFSITNKFAKYIVENEPFIIKTFKYGYCVDEIVIPTLMMNSSFKDNIYPSMNLRLVDWTRGAPYVWQKEDFEELMGSEQLFARKFSYSNHPEIVEKIKQHLLDKYKVKE